MKKPLSETNPYLKDPVMRKKLIEISVRTSCGVEGIEPKSPHTRVIKIKNRSPKRIYKSNAIIDHGK